MVSKKLLVAAVAVTFLLAKLIGLQGSEPTPTASTTTAVRGEAESGWVAAKAVAQVDHPLTGVYVDPKVQGQSKVVVLPSNDVWIMRHCQAPEQGRVSGKTLSALGLTADLNGDSLGWSNGVVWEKKGSELPNIGIPVNRPALPALRGKHCPGRDPKVYISRSRIPFYLCTHGKGDVVSSEFIRKGWWVDCVQLPALVQILRQIFPGEQLKAVDVGGNIGTCTMVLASEGVSVTTFEPAPINYELVEKSLSLNERVFPPGGGVTLHRAGAGSKKSTVLVRSEEGNFGGGFVQKSHQDIDYRVRGERPKFINATAYITRLDDEVKHHVHLLKMDCQGHEIEVLLGARELMTKHRVDIVRTEFNWGLLHMSEHEPVKLLELLDDYGYTLVIGGKVVTRPEFAPFAAGRKGRDDEIEVYAVNKQTVPEVYWSCFS